MKKSKQEIYNLIKDFLIKHHIKIILISAPVFGILGFSGMVVYNQSSYFCKKCHQNQGTYVSLDLKIPEHQEEFNGGQGCLNVNGSNSEIHDNVFIKLQIEKNQYSGCLMITINFDKDAPNFSIDKNIMRWSPTF